MHFSLRKLRVLSGTAVARTPRCDGQVYAYGFERPSAVQQRAVLPILKGRDVLIALYLAGVGA